MKQEVASIDYWMLIDEDGVLKIVDRYNTETGLVSLELDQFDQPIVHMPSTLKLADQVETFVKELDAAVTAMKEFSKAIAEWKRLD